MKYLAWPNGYYRYYWGLSYRCITTQCSGVQTGPYGYYRYRIFGTFGDASSDNQGIFVQDNWRVNRKLTLNIGIRTEREFLPSFSIKGQTTAAPPIEFGWGSKVSPRIGGAFDPKGDGKMRFYASWGYFYDVMKYEMPRGSFGGDIWWDYYYSLDDPNWVRTLQGVPADPYKLPGRFFEAVNWRIPSNDPNDFTVDPDLKPMKQRMFDIGYDYSITSNLVASLRYTNRRLIRTIEDVGTLGPQGEIYYIANPGFGIVADPKRWEPGIPTTPKAVRDYDAIEFRLDRRFARNYQYAISYTWSRSYGNYSGLASSDENGRTSPNVNRYFDLPWIGYTQTGVPAMGRPRHRPAAHLQVLRRLQPEVEAGHDDLRSERPAVLGHAADDRGQRHFLDAGLPVRPRRHGPYARLLQLRLQPDARLRAFLRPGEHEVPLRVHGVQPVQLEHRDQQERGAAAPGLRPAPVRARC